MSSLRHALAPTSGFAGLARGLTLALGLSLGLATAWPAYAREDAVPGSRYTSGRGAALGDAMLPLADDGASSLFYNPAGLGKIRGVSLEPLNFGFYGNTGYFNTFDATKFYKVTSLSSYAPTLAKNPGVFSGVGASVLPAFAFRGFGFGILYQDQVGAEANADGSFRYKSLYQFIPTAGGALRLADGIVRIGYSLQWVNESAGDITLPSTTAPVGYNQGLASGSGLSHNVGFALTLPYTYLPAFNLVARNVGGLHFAGTSFVPLAKGDGTTPANEAMSVDGSVSMTFKLGGGSTMNAVLEDRDATDTSGVSLLGRGAFALEYSLRDSFFLRGGWAGGYPSLGLGMRRPRGEFNLSWYSEEIGGGYHVQRDIRMLLQYQVRAF